MQRRVTHPAFLSCRSLCSLDGPRLVTVIICCFQSYLQNQPQLSFFMHKCVGGGQTDRQYSKLRAKSNKLLSDCKSKFGCVTWRGAACANRRMVRKHGSPVVGSQRSCQYLKIKRSMNIQSFTGKSFQAPFMCAGGT